MIRLDRSFKLNRAITNQSKEAITSAENKELLKCLRGQKSVSTLERERERARVNILFNLFLTLTF